MRSYVEALLEGTSTREEPGMIYEGMFYPEEEVDFELFDREEIRVGDLAGEEFYGK